MYRFEATIARVSGAIAKTVHKASGPSRNARIEFMTCSELPYEDPGQLALYCSDKRALPVSADNKQSTIYMAKASLSSVCITVIGSIRAQLSPPPMVPASKRCFLLPCDPGKRKTSMNPFQSSWVPAIEPLLSRPY